MFYIWNFKTSCWCFIIILLFISWLLIPAFRQAGTIRVGGASGAPPPEGASPGENQWFRGAAAVLSGSQRIVSKLYFEFLDFLNFWFFKFFKVLGFFSSFLSLIWLKFDGTVFLWSCMKMEQTFRWAESLFVKFLFISF